MSEQQESTGSRIVNSVKEGVSNTRESIRQEVDAYEHSDSKKKQYAIGAGIACLVLSLFCVGFYVIRLTSSDPNRPNTLSSLWHTVMYGGMAGMASLGLFGALRGQASYLLYFFLGLVGTFVFEVCCLVVGVLIQGDANQRPGIFAVIITVVVLIVFGTSALFVFLWRRKLAPMSTIDVTLSEDPTKIRIKN